MKILDILFHGFIWKIPKSLLWCPLLWLIGGIPVMLEGRGIDSFYNPGPLGYWIFAGTVVSILGFFYSVITSIKK